MYYIEVKFYEGKEFYEEFCDKDKFAITDIGIEWGVSEKEAKKFETPKKAKEHFNTLWDANDIENECIDREMQGVRFILRNTDDKTCYEVIAEATYSFRIKRYY